MSDQQGRPDPAAMMARLDQMREQAQATLARFDEMKAKLGAEAVEVYSEDGLLKVKLDGEGNVAEIRIDEYAMRMRQSLGPAIIALIGEAKATFGVKSAELAQAVVGDQFDVMGMLSRDMPDYMRERAKENLDRNR